MKDQLLERRRLLTVTAGLGVAALAGCVGTDDDENDQIQDDADDGDDTEDDAAEDEEMDGDESEPTGDGEGFVIEGDFELPTDPSPDDFLDLTGAEEVEIETIWRTDNDPEFVFDPPFVRVDEGTTVRWVNTDGVFHTVTATESLESRSQSGAFNETISSEGGTFEWEADSTGRQNYYCTPHAGFMYGSIDVV